MTASTTQFSVLRERCGASTSDAIESLLREAPDFRVNRVNPIAFAKETGLDETNCIGAFLHATQLGLVDLAWNVVCGGCGGVLHSANSLRSIDRACYRCALCTADCSPVLDDNVEVTFTVSKQFRAISAHEPEGLPLWDYVRQVYWSSGSDLPVDLLPAVDGIALNSAELLPGTSASLTVSVAEGMVVVFDPVTHSSTLLEIIGQSQQAAQAIAISIGETMQAPTPVRVASGHLEILLENRAKQRILPILWVVGDPLRELVTRRMPSLSAKRLLSHQTFRELYQTEVLDINQRFSISSLTFMFTDLKGSTALYSRVGDLAAFDLIRAHFQILTDIIAKNSGAVVKTIGDAVMASFPTPSNGMTAALSMKEAMVEFNARHGSGDIALKIGLHSGACIAVTLNERQDYFGQVVNIAARVQTLAAKKIVATEAIMRDPDVRSLLETKEVQIDQSRRRLRGVDEDMLVYDIWKR